MAQENGDILAGPDAPEVNLQALPRVALLEQTLTMPAAQVTKEIYVAAALSTDSAELDVLAGAVAELASLTPNTTAAELRSAIGELWTLLLAHAPRSAYDLTGTPERRVSRLLGRVVSVLPASSRDAACVYARKYVTALRTGLDQPRALTRLESLYDQQGAYEVFRREAWGRFVDAVRAAPVLASVVNEATSPFVQTLQVRTTDSATAMLDLRALEPLETFVRAHLRPDGAVVANGAEVGGLVGQAGESATVLARAYANNAFALNRAEEAYLRATSAPLSPNAPAAADPAADLKRAIEAAMRVQTDLDGTLKDIRGGTSGTLGFVAQWFKVAGFEEASDIEKVAKATTTILDGLQKYSKSAITVAERVAKIFPADGQAAAIIGSAVLTGGLVAVAVQVFAIFGGGPPDKMAQVLAIVKEIKEIVTEIKQEMHARFDRIDGKLNRMLDTILQYFALVDWEIGETQVQVAEVQSALYELQSELSRLERNVYTFMNALSHQPLLESITGNLRYLERTGVEMPYTPTYVDAENDFYVWARELSRDELLGGPLQRSFSDDALLAELTNYPLATNINYLSQFLLARFGLPALSTARLSNPLDWGVASESYAQLAEEWPAHAARIAPSRLADVQDSGQTLATALNAIASPALFTKLAEYYQNAFAAVKARIGEFEAAYEQDPTNRLYGVDLWGGPDQVPTQSYLSQAWDLPSCSGRPFGEVATLPFAFRHADYLPYGALMLGHNLGAGTLGACIAGEWSLYSSEPTGLGGTWRYLYRLRVVVHITYSGTHVLTHSFTTTRERQNVRRPDVPFNPNTAWPPEPEVAAEWPRIRSLPSAVSLVSPSFMNQVRSGVTQSLLARQRDFYSKVAQRCRQAGTPIHAAVRVLSGSKRLWESYVVLGLPTALEQSDYLRSLLYGNGAVFTGSDIGDDDGLLNDVEDVYTYTAAQATLPAQNVMAGLDALQAERAVNLRDEIARILRAMQTAGEREGEDLVRSTLLQLSILPQA